MVATAGFNEDLRIMMTLQANAVGVSNVLKQIKTLRFEMDKLQSRYRGLQTFDPGKSSMTAAITESLGDRSQWRGPLDGIVEQAQKSFASKGGSAGEVFGKAINSGLDGELSAQSQAIARATKGYNKQLSSSTFKSLGQAGNGRDLSQIYEIDDFAQNIKNSTKQVATFNFAWLGVMFAGMELQRVFGGLFGTMMQGYRDAQASNSAFNTTMSQLGAQFSYVKFLFMDAFVNSPLFSWAIESAQGLLDKLAKLPDDVKVWTVGLIITLAVLGTMLFTIGQMALGIQAMKGLGLGKMFADAGTNASTLSSTLKGIGLGPILGIAAGILFAVNWIRKGIQYSGDWGDAFKFVANQAGIMLLRLLQGLVWLFKQVGRLIIMVIGGVFDMMLASVKTNIANVLEFFASILDKISFVIPAAGKLAKELRDVAPDKGLTFGITSTALDGFNDTMDRMDILQKRIDTLKDFNRVYDEMNLDNASPVATTPVSAQPSQVTIGEINIDGAQDPSAVMDELANRTDGLFSWYDAAQENASIRYGSPS